MNVTEQWKDALAKLECVFFRKVRWTAHLYFLMESSPLFSRWVAWTLTRWKSCRAGTQGFPSAAQGRRLWSVAPCMSPTPTWPEPRSTLPTTPTPPHTSTLTFLSTTSIPTSVWWITTPESEPCSPGTTGTRCYTTSRCFMSSGATARTTHGTTEGSVIVCPWKVVQLTTHIHSLTQCYNQFRIWVTAGVITTHHTWLSGICLKVTGENPSLWRRKLTASATRTLMEKKRGIGQLELIHILLRFTPFTSQEVILEFRFQLKKKGGEKKCNEDHELNFDLGLGATVTEMFWACHVIVDVFSQHGCLIIKSLSKFAKTLVFSVLVQSLRGESSHPCTSACMSTYVCSQNEGMVSSSHTDINNTARAVLYVFLTGTNVKPGATRSMTEELCAFSHLPSVLRRAIKY